jgi:hypothetical protein
MRDVGGKARLVADIATERARLSGELDRTKAAL